MAKGALTKTPKTGGKVYAGGSSSFDERTGRRTAPPQGSERLSPGVYRAPDGGLVTAAGRAIPRPQPTSRPGLASAAVQGVAPGLSAALGSQKRTQSAQPMMQASQNQIYQLPQGQRFADNMAQQIAWYAVQNPPSQPVDMQKPWMNAQMPAMPSLPQRPSFFELAQMNPQQQQQAVQPTQPQQPMEMPSNGQLTPEQLARLMGRYTSNGF